MLSADASCCAGIATSLRILFTPPDCVQQAPPYDQPQLQLERNELIALVNLLERLSNSIEVVQRMSRASQGPGPFAAEAMR